MSCERCGWEFIIDSDGDVTDDGEAEPEAELEIDDDGEIVPARSDGPWFAPWHAIVSLEGGRENSLARDGPPSPTQRGNRPFSEAEVPIIEVAVCPNCGHQSKKIRMGAVVCPDCDYYFSITPNDPYVGIEAYRGEDLSVSPDHDEEEQETIP